MVDPQALERARQAVSQILGHLGIVRVVCVDDEYRDSAGVEDAIAAAVGLAPEEIRDALPEVGEANLDEPDVRSELIRRALDGLQADTKLERTEKLLAVARLKDGDATDDKADASVLEQLVSKAQLIPLTAQKWRERGDTLLSEDSGQPTLFLFDQDLSQDGGGPTDGMRIIAAVLSSDTRGTRICGLLTHTVTPEDEHEQWRQLARDFGVTPDRFIVVSKRWLGRDPLVFAQKLKLAALSPDFARLKGKSAEIQAAAAAAAKKQVEEISIFDLEHIVFRVPAAEGTWEPDMLFRLHSLFSRTEARRLAHEGGELESLAKRLRSVSHIPTDSETQPAPSTFHIQRLELYEQADYLNRNHLPIELGDIFAKTGGGGKKAYILLSQPCDLMVRSDGQRHPELEYLTLVEVTQADEVPKHSEELDYFGVGPAERHFVRLKLVHQVRSCMIDLCALNAEGVARIEVGNECPDGVRPAWHERYKRLTGMYEKRLNRLKVLFPEKGDSADASRTKDAIRKAVLSDLLDAGPFRGAIADENGRKVVTFNCRRVGHLSRERAFGLLMAYTSCLTRPGHERDFGKPLDIGEN